MKTTVAAIDFGTSKIVTLVAENSGNQSCDVVACGLAAYDGFLPDPDCWNDPNTLNDRIQDSIHDAEEQIHNKIREINVGVPAAFTRAYVSTARITLKGADPRVTAGDIKALFKKAEENLCEAIGVRKNDFEQAVGIIVHSSPAWFKVDDGRETLMPMDKKGRELSGLVSFVVARRGFVEDVNARLNSLGYVVRGFFSTAAGEGMLFLDEEERDRTCALVDVGYINTDIIVMEGDAITFMKSIPMGGGNITGDLAVSLDIPMNDAEERIKRSYVYITGTNTSEETYEIPAGEGQKPKTFTRSQVGEIINGCVDDLAGQITGALETSGTRLGQWSKVYLTGGGLSFNRGAREYLGDRLNRTVLDAPKRAATMNSHAYSSALGLMDLIVNTDAQNHPQSASKGGALKDFFHSLWGN